MSNIIEKAFLAGRSKSTWKQFRNDYASELCFNEKLISNLNSLKNTPLYQDSGLWQVRSEDMEGVLFQQMVNEPFEQFIYRVYYENLTITSGEFAGTYPTKET
jgi:hypothetical protein